MTENEILENLCWYDPRNPAYDSVAADGREPRINNCGCDSCHYGSDELAVALLSGKRTECWVLQLNNDYTANREPYYAKAPF